MAKFKPALGTKKKVWAMEQGFSYYKYLWRDQ